MKVFHKIPLFLLNDGFPNGHNQVRNHVTFDPRNMRLKRFDFEAFGLEKQIGAK